MNNIGIGCLFVSIIIIGAVAYQTVAHNNQAEGFSVNIDPESVAFNYTSPNVTYYRMTPKTSVYNEMSCVPAYYDTAYSIDEEECNGDKDYIYVAEEGKMKWNWYSVDTSALPEKPEGYVDEIIITIGGMYVGQATTHVCTAIAPKGYSFETISNEFISNNQSMVYPFYRRVQYKWEYNPADTGVCKTWKWSDIKEDFQVGVGAYYNNYDNENGEVRISQLYVDVGVETGAPTITASKVTSIQEYSAQVEVTVTNAGASHCAVIIEHREKGRTTWQKGDYVTTVENGDTFYSMFRGLSSGKTYEWRVAGIQDGMKGLYDYGPSFTTKGTSDGEPTSNDDHQIFDTKADAVAWLEENKG
jgi:hypothetical protein